MVRVVILICVGLLLGLLAGGFAGMLLGGALGLLLGLLVEARSQMAKLAAKQQGFAQQLSGLQQRLTVLEQSQSPVQMSPSPPSLVPERGTVLAGPAKPPIPNEVTDEGIEEGTGEGASAQSASLTQELLGLTVPGEVPAASDVAPPSRDERVRALSPSPVDKGLDTLRSLFFGGNTVVRSGVLVLLVGISLLLKYAAEHVYFPLELRMAAVALIGLTLVAIGFWQRVTRPGFSRTLQGGGVAVMYLVVFFSFRTYGLVPAGLAFALLLGIALLSAMLAVMQDAMALVVIGQIGGFMAPVLANTGTGDHIALFSYYTLLNLAIVGIAYFKAWRALNLIGFVFTFGIGSTWGVLRYRPEDFASTEPFLLVFFLIYLAIPVLFAWRRPSQGSAWIDGSLVFGLPLATLALQRALVAPVPFGMAYSTLGLAAIYIGLAWVLLRRAPQSMGTLAEAFLAIGIGFATLAVPYGLDNHYLTGATWALEGAGLYWVGVRQQRWLSRWAGVALQLIGGAAVALPWVSWVQQHDAPVAIDMHFVAAAFVCVGSLFIARYAHYRREQVGAREASMLQILIVWALCFWVPAGLAEISRHCPEHWQASAALIFLAGTGLVLETVGARLQWLPGRFPALLLLPIMAYMLLSPWRFGDHLLSNGGWLGWSFYAAAVVWVLRHLVPDAPSWARYLHALWLWLLAAFSALELYTLMTKRWWLDSDWAVAVSGASVALLLGLTVWLRQSQRWPFVAYRDVYLTWGAGGLVVALSLWLVLLNMLVAGSAQPLPYVPLVNPIDLAQLITLIAFGRWYLACRHDAELRVDVERLNVLLLLISVLAFIAFNGLLARSVHHLAGVPFDSFSLWRSVPLQIALSISWTLIGLGVTVLASRRGLRIPWMIGATLLGIVVFKLFLVDLDKLDALSKIVTFLVVGVLLLLVGYLAPVPPSNSRNTSDLSSADESVTPGDLAKGSMGD